MKIELHVLLADGRMSEVDLVLDDEPVRRSDANALAAVGDLDRFVDPQHANVRGKLANAGCIDEMHEREGASVDDRNLGAVDVNVQIRDPAGHQSGEKMLDSTDGNVIAADRRGVIESRRRRLQRRNAQAEVRANERDAAAGVGRMKFDFGVDAGVEADAGDADFGVDGLAFNVHVRWLQEQGECHRPQSPLNAD